MFPIGEMHYSYLIYSGVLLFYIRWLVCLHATLTLSNTGGFVVEEDTVRMDLSGGATALFNQVGGEGVEGAQDGVWGPPSDL